MPPLSKAKKALSNGVRGVSNGCSRAWHCFRYENRDITAWLKTACARGPTTTIVSLFSSTALLFLAQSIDFDCDDRVDIGIANLKITSVLSGATVIENIVNVFLSPYFGALADSSSNRKGLLIWSSFAWVGGMGLGAVVLFFEPSLVLLWLYFLSMLIVAVFYELALLLVFAYLPEIVHDQEQLTAITSRQYAIVNFVQLLAAAVMVVIVGIIGDDTFPDDLPFTIIAHFLVVGWFFYYGVPGLYYLPRRGKIQDSTVVKTHAISQIFSTMKKIKKSYPNVLYFLLAWIFFFAGVYSVTVLQVAYVTEEFDYETGDVAYIGGVLLIAAVVGAGLAEKLSKILRLKILLMFAVCLWAVTTLVAPFALRGQERNAEDIKNESDTTNPSGCDDFILLTREPTPFAAFFVYVISMLFGFGVGFIYPVSTAIYSLIIPGGEEATYFGLKTFGSKLLAWAPPLVFTAINEANGLQFAFVSLSFWFFASIPFIYLLDVDQGIEQVKHTLHLRQGAGKRDIIAEHEEEEAKAIELASPLYAVAEILQDEAPAETENKDMEDPAVLDGGQDRNQSIVSL